MSSTTASVFISHASQDRRIAESLCAALESRGFRCWLASRDVAGGANFAAEIVRAIRSAKVMLLVFTTHANNSDEIKKDLVLASQNRLIVIPLRVEEIAPNDAFAYELATRQWIDMFDDWERALERLAARMAAVLDADAQPGEPAPADGAANSRPAGTMTSTASVQSVGAPPSSAPRAAAPGSPAGGSLGFGRGGKRGWIIGAVALAVVLVAVLAYRSSNKPSPDQSAPAASAILQAAPPPEGRSASKMGSASTTSAGVTGKPPPPAATVTIDTAMATAKAAYARKDYAQAIIWFRKAADQGDRDAETVVGSFYQNGWGVPQDYAQAAIWYRKAAGQGNATAQFELGWFYLSGEGVVRDYAQAMTWLRKAADHGFPQAESDIGLLYEKGWGVPQDYGQAMAWYRKAADQDDALAQNSVGWFYQNGQGVAQDYGKAVAWYRKAAEQGHAGAQNNLGWLVHERLGRHAGFWPGRVLVSQGG